jgi:hypothetical protein
MSNELFDAAELMALAQAEISSENHPGNPNWREAPVSGLQKPRTPVDTDSGVFEAPNRLMPLPAHFLGGSYEDGKTVKARFKRLADSPWKVVDVETSGRTPYSVPIRTKNRADGILRCRIISCTWTNADGGVEMAAWDIDTMDETERVLLAKACMTQTFIAHNASFDLGWLLHLISDSGGTVTDKIWPKQVLCTLHLSRQLYPEIRRVLRIAANEASDPRQDWIQKRILKDRGMDNWGGTLVDVSYALNLPWSADLDKSYQKPANWVLRAPLSPGHYNYVQDDALLPAVIVHRLLDGGMVDVNSQKSREEMALEAAAYLSQNVDKLKANPKLAMYFNITHDAVRHVVNISRKGMPYDPRLSAKYKSGMQMKLNAAVDTINDINFPHLVEHKDILRDPAIGNSSVLIEAWLKSFRQYDPYVRIPKTMAGEWSLSAKDLRKNHLDKTAVKPVYDLLSIIQKSKQAVKMVDNLDQFVNRAIQKNGIEYAKGVLDRGIARLHPLLGFGPGTDRLSSNDPNAQNFPRDPNFRALVRAKPGHKIISADYGQIELRIAAGLALRAQDEWNKIFANPDHKEPTEIGTQAMTNLRRLWTLLETKAPEDWDTVEKKIMGEEKHWDDTLKNKLASFNQYDAVLSDTQDDGMPVMAPTAPVSEMSYQKIKDARDMRRLMIFAIRIFRKRKENKTEMFGALAIAFREGIDPHLFTGLAMAQNSGKDIGGDDPLTVLRDAMKLGKEGVDALKSKFKVERNNAKAVNFGLLYGMTAPTLHTTGVVTYGSDWSLEEAQAASDAWFGLYPELGFWQYFTILRPEWEGTAQVCKVNKRAGTAKVDKKELRSWRVTSLYGREYVREGFREGLNYQDQGTGAHMVFKAMTLMSKEVREMLIDQIHDEILAEVPDEKVDKVLAAIEHAMEKAGREALGKYNIPVEAEAEVGEVWMHGEKPTIPLDPDVELTQEMVDAMAIPEEDEDMSALALT